MMKVEECMIRKVKNQKRRSLKLSSAKFLTAVKRLSMFPCFLLDIITDHLYALKPFCVFFLYPFTTYKPGGHGYRQFNQ